MENESCIYVISAIRTETPSVSTLLLEDECGRIPRYAPGQTIDVYFPETGKLAGKPYSISSASHEQMCAITVHAIGEFSNRLCAMKPGDRVQGSMPYGSFRPRTRGSDLILLASGMGITSFQGLLQHALSSDPLRHVALLYTVRSVNDFIFKDELDCLSETYKNFSATYFVTRDRSPGTANYTERRMRASDALSHVRDVRNTEFLICGSFSFTHGMQKTFVKNGVAQNTILSSCTSSLSGVFMA